ncbi:MAG: response regulator [Spirochaetota bacterium]
MNFLVVDSSPMIKSIITSTLTGMNFNFFFASSRGECMQECSKRPFQIITMAIHLADGDGFALCHQLRHASKEDSFQSSSDAIIIFLTADDTIEVREQGFAAGASEFLLKNHIRSQLKDRIERLLYPKNIFKGARLLIVDDSFMNRLIIKQLLRKIVPNITEADNGKQALEILQENKVSYDMILTDFYMPEVTGPELCQRLRKMHRYVNLPIIILTGSNDRSDVLEIFKSGANDFLTKPFIKEELLARIEIHLKAWFLQKQV